MLHIRRISSHVLIASTAVLPTTTTTTMMMMITEMSYKLWVFESSKAKQNNAKQFLYRPGEALKAPEG